MDTPAICVMELAARDMRGIMLSGFAGDQGRAEPKGLGDLLGVMDGVMDGVRLCGVLFGVLLGVRGTESPIRHPSTPHMLCPLVLCSSFWNPAPNANIFS
jgi:hypothetical protein